ncbi:MAG: DUF4340 domain-containing protein, partial [Phycisphaerales bacterium]
MKPAPLLALVGVSAVVLFGGYALLSSRNAPTPVTVAAHAKFLPEFGAAADSAAAVIIRKNKTDLVLQKQGDTWVLPDKDGFPADSARVRDTLRTFAKAEIIEPKTSKPELYDRLAVEDPDADKSAATLVTIKDSGGKILCSVIMGRKQFDAAGASPLDDAAGPKNFARRAGEAQSYLISGDFHFEADAKEWMIRSLEDLRPERVRQVQVLKGDQVVADISRPSASETKYTLAQLPEGRKLKDDYVLTRLANSLAGVTFDDVAKADTVHQGAAEASTLRVKCFDGLVIDAKGTKKGNDWWWTMSAAYEPPPEAESKPDGPAPDAKPQDQPSDKPETAPSDTPNAAPQEAKPTAPTPDSASDKPKAPAGPSDALKAEIDALNERWKGWAYQLPSPKSTQMAPGLEDLLAPLPKPAAEG